MNAIWKPTQLECDAIRKAASREGRVAFCKVVLEPANRYNTEDTERNKRVGAIPLGELNIALLSDNLDWDDTDLNDYGTWADFRKGVALTEDGRAIVDFYIRERGDEYRDLHGNVTLDYAGGKIIRIRGYSTAAGNDFPLPHYPLMVAT